MQLNAMESVQAISKYLSFLSDVTLMLNEIGDLSINKYAETALLDMFEIFYGVKFVNTNISNKNNPSIDLISEEGRIAIQITSNPDLKKVQDCIKKFFEYKYYEKVDSLFVFSITPKQRFYTQNKIDSLIQKCLAKVGDKGSFNFDAKQHIVDKASFLLSLDLNDTIKLKRIESALSKQFGAYREKENLNAYYEGLKDKFYDVVMNDNVGMNLKDIYVEPYFKVHRLNVRDRAAFDDEYDEFLCFKNRYSIHSCINDFLSTENSNKTIAQANFILLLGYPGQGKTSFCKKLAYDYLTNPSLGNRALFYFKLKDVPNSKQLINSPISVLLDEARVLTKTEISTETFRNSVLILDGLDELFMKDGLRLDDIEVLCKELIREVERENANLQVVVTSRMGYVDLDKLHINKFNVFHLESLDKAQQIQWLEKYLEFHPNTWLTLEKLKLHHKNKSYLVELMEQPLLIHMVASLEKEVSQEITKTQVYDQLFTELIQRKYSSDGQIQILKDINERDLRKLVREVAFNIYKTGQGYVTRKVLLADQNIQNFLKKLPINDFRESLKGIMVSFYFQERSTVVRGEIEDEKEYVIEFLHKSLEEFMVAEKVCEDMQTFFLSKSREGDYSLNDSHEALQKLNGLFSKAITREIHEYLIQKLNILDDNVKRELVQRIVYFFDDFVRKDFIASFDSRHQSDPLSLSFSTFNSVWLILSKLDYGNHLNEKNRKKVVNYLVCYNNMHPSLSSGDFTHQDLSGAEITGCRYLPNFSFAILDNCEFNHVMIVGETLYNASIEEAEILDFDCYDVDIIDSSFARSTISDSKFVNVVFVNVDFSGCDISDCIFKNVKFKNARKDHFFDIRIKLDDLLRLLELKVKIDLKKSLFMGGRV